MRANFGQGIMAAAVSTIVGVVVYCGILFAAGESENIKLNTLGAWAAVYFVVMIFLLSYIFKKPDQPEKTPEPAKPEVLDED